MIYKKVWKIENILCLNEVIKQSFVYGDKKNYLVALIVCEKEINNEKIKEKLKLIFRISWPPFYDI